MAAAKKKAKVKRKKARRESRRSAKKAKPLKKAAARKPAARRRGAEERAGCTPAPKRVQRQSLRLPRAVPCREERVGFVTHYYGHLP